jgi:hypothetical protein
MDFSLAPNPYGGSIIAPVATEADSFRKSLLVDLSIILFNCVTFDEFAVVFLREF